MFPFGAPLVRESGDSPLSRSTQYDPCTRGMMGLACPRGQPSETLAEMATGPTLSRGRGSVTSLGQTILLLVDTILANTNRLSRENECRSALVAARESLLLGNNLTESVLQRVLAARDRARHAPFQQIQSSGLPILNLVSSRAPLSDPVYHQIAREMASFAQQQGALGWSARQVSQGPMPGSTLIPQLKRKEDTDAIASERTSKAITEEQVKIVPSERKNMNLSNSCDTPMEALRVLSTLGTTLRSKSDPFINAAAIPDPGFKLAPLTPRRGTCEFFPDKLYRMLHEVPKEGLADIVSFLPHGRAFRVHKQDRFVNEIMPKYFSNLGKWSSFSRQCNLWGFLRVTSGKDEKAYYHELFIRGHSNLCRFLRRVGVPHGLDRRRYKLPEGHDPDFWAMEPAPEFEEPESRSLKKPGDGRLNDAK